MAEDLEQVIREVFEVKICERVGPGFLSAVDFPSQESSLERRGFSWTHDPKHTLPMAKAFGCKGKKQLEQAQFHVSVAPGSKTVGKGLRDGADTQRERDTALLFHGRNSAVCGTGQTGNAIRHEGSSKIHARSHACGKGACSNDCASITARRPVLSWTFP